MKKLIAVSGLLLMVGLSIVTASPLPMLLSTPSAWTNFVVLGVDPSVSGVTAYADEHKRDIIATMVNGLDIAQDITVIPNIKNKIALTKLSIADGFRPYSATEEIRTTANVSYADRYLEVLQGKREIELDIRALQGKHLAWRTSPGSRASKTFNDLDFAAFTWQEVIKSLQAEINDETAYYGFAKADAVAYNAGNAYVVGDYVTFSDASFTGGVTEYYICTVNAAPADTPATDTDKWQNVTARAVVPGLKYHIDAAITGGFSATTTGAVNSGATAIAAMKELYRDMPIPYKKNGVIIHASYTDCEYLMDGQSDIYKYTQADMNSNGGAIQLFGTNGKCWVKPASWLGTSRRLIAEPMAGGTMMGANLVMGTDLLSDANDIVFDNGLWTVKAGISVVLGFQIQDLSALRLGDQA